MIQAGAMRCATFQELRLHMANCYCFCFCFCFPTLLRVGAGGTLQSLELLHHHLAMGLVGGVLGKGVQVLQLSGGWGHVQRENTPAT